jgi:hypothetical protein
MADSIKTICAAILTGIRASNTVSATMSAQFTASTTLSLFLGLDAKNLPAESELPWCAAIPRAYGRVDAWDHRENEITMAVAIKTATTTGTATTTFKAYDGIDTVTALADAIHSATATVLADNMLNLSDIQLESDHPYYRASWTFRVPTAT